MWLSPSRGEKRGERKAGTGGSSPFVPAPDSKRVMAIARNLTNARTIKNLLTEVGITLNENIDLGDNSVLLVGTGSGQFRRAGLIPMLSRRFERQTGRVFDFLQSQTITFDGTGYNSLYMPNKYLPIVTLRSLEITDGIGYAVDDVTVDKDTGEIRLKTAAALVSYVPGYGLAPTMQSRQDRPRFPKGVVNVTAVLDYGFADAAGTAFEPPEDVQGAVAAAVITDILHREAATDGRGAGAQSRSIEYWSENLGGKGRWMAFIDYLKDLWRDGVENWRLGIDFS